MLEMIRIKYLKWIVPCLAAGSALLYTLCILYSFDSEIGYFNPSPLLVATRIVFGLSLVVPLFFVIAAKDVKEYPTTYDPSAVALRRYDRKLAAFPVLGFLVCGSGLLIPYTSAINAVCAVLCLCGIVFFAQMLGTKMSALWGLPIVVFCLIRMYAVYTNFRIPLNSPLKESVLYGLLSILLVVLAEMQCMTSEGKPRYWFFSMSIVSSVGASAGIPFLIYYIRQEEITSSLAVQAFLSLTMAGYCIYRLTSVLRPRPADSADPTEPADTETETAADDSEEPSGQESQESTDRGQIQ